MQLTIIVMVFFGAILNYSEVKDRIFQNPNHSFDYLFGILSLQVALTKEQIEEIIRAVNECAIKEKASQNDVDDVIAHRLPTKLQTAFMPAYQNSLDGYFDFTLRIAK